MGLRNFFRSRNDGLKPDPKLRWFGKLPTYADYYRTQGDEAWTVELCDWLLKGFELYCARQAGEGRRPERLANAIGVLRLPESQMTALVAFFDFGGDARGRPFPMCFYVGIPTELCLGLTLDRVAGVLKVLGDLMELRQEVELFTASARSIDDVFGSREMEVGALETNSMGADLWVTADQVDWNVWFDRIKPLLRIEDRAAWLSCVEAFGANLTASESRTFEPTVSFPIAGQSPLEIQVAGWIVWLGHRIDLGRRSLSLFVSGDLQAGPGSLTTVAHDLMPEDFLLLTSQATSLSYLDSLERVGGADGNSDSPCSEELEFRHESWRKFMDSGSAAT